MTVTCSLVVEKVTEHAGVSRARLLSSDKRPDIVLVRDAAFWLCKRLTGRSLPWIAQMMGGRHHTTVLAGIRRARTLIEQDADFAGMVATIEAAILAAHAENDQQENDPLKLAAGLVQEPGRTVLTLPQQILLARSVQDYAAEAARQSAMVTDLQAALARRTNETPTPVPPTVRDVVAAFGALQQSAYTSAEPAARLRLERTLKTLKSTMEKLK